MATTNTASTAYFSQDSRRVHFPFLIFFPGILYSSSWMSPKGQKKPQISRPRARPSSSKIPTMYKGSLLGMALRAFCREPRGQAATAPGQE